MKDHTLMQTIARANRVTSHQVNGVTKTNGEIVDYYNVFRNMKKALIDYAQGQEDAEEGSVREKAELFLLLDEAIAQGMTFCQEKGADLSGILESREVFKNLEWFKECADTLLGNDEWRVAVFQYLRGVIDTPARSFCSSHLRFKIRFRRPGMQRHLK